jgi:phosphate starvation-inducible protein PhoH
MTLFLSSNVVRHPPVQKIINADEDYGLKHSKPKLQATEHY